MTDLENLAEGVPIIDTSYDNNFVVWNIVTENEINESFIEDLNEKLSVNGISAVCFKKQTDYLTCQYKFSPILIYETYWDTSLRNLLVIEAQLGNIIAIENRPRKYWKLRFAINEQVGGFNIDKTPLMNAIQKSNVEEAKKLIKNSTLAQVNAKTPFGRTALHYAANSENIELVKLLLESGAEVNITGEITPLQEASVKNLDILKLLISNKAEINLSNKYNETALMFAASAGRLDFVSWLLENKADKNLMDVFGETAINKAQKNNHLKVMKRLE